jgi:hypothetical protein
VSHRERFARARHAEQDLMSPAALQSLGELLDRLRLIALGFKIGDDAELSFVAVANHQEKRIAALRPPNKLHDHLPGVA